MAKQIVTLGYSISGGMQLGTDYIPCVGYLSSVVTAGFICVASASIAVAAATGEIACGTGTGSIAVGSATGEMVC